MNVSRHPTMHKTALTTKNFQYKMSIGLRLRNPDLKQFMALAVNWLSNPEAFLLHSSTLSS